MESLSSKKRVRFDSGESEYNSVKTQRTSDNLLEVLDDPDSDLDSFMKSFENEIPKLPESFIDCDSVSGESQPDLGFLFEASDDELGLPPTDLTPVESEKIGISVEVGEVWDQISGYDSFEYGFGYAGGDATVSAAYNGGEYVALDGLFDYTDVGFRSSEPELPPQPETMPAQ
ncbi:unnamed protein product [Lactuca saligna]|uniref:Uncharacterized protein n=1 Tax=Lactuca saligna TaxID=75948 RepID=A0AA36E1M4_LACSI|nr:unnamed protein product [Lactuca saligna]